jgi:hypothetical protein
MEVVVEIDDQLVAGLGAGPFAVGDVVERRCRSL